MSALDSVRILVIAGHDPTGGAGVDADREAIEAHGGEARTVLTALTDQDGTAVRSLGARDPGAWLAEARAELAGPGEVFGAVKTGLLPGVAHVRALGRLLDELRPGTPIVVDPVLAASGGEPFLDDAGIETLLAEIVPRGVILTPNLPETALLTGVPMERLQATEARIEAGQGLLRLGAGLVVLKGGHGAEDPVLDLVLMPGEAPHVAKHPRIAGGSLHGSGCRFASTLATALARGVPAPDAVEAAGAFVANLIAGGGSALGDGSGPR